MRSALNISVDWLFRLLTVERPDKYVSPKSLTGDYLRRSIRVVGIAAVPLLLVIGLTGLGIAAAATGDPEMPPEKRAAIAAAKPPTDAELAQLVSAPSVARPVPG